MDSYRQIEMAIARSSGCHADPSVTGLTTDLPPLPVHSFRRHSDTAGMLAFQRSRNRLTHQVATLL